MTTKQAWLKQLNKEKIDYMTNFANNFLLIEHAHFDESYVDVLDVSTSKGYTMGSITYYTNLMFSTKILNKLFELHPPANMCVISDTAIMPNGLLKEGDDFKYLEKFWLRVVFSEDGYGLIVALEWGEELDNGKFVQITYETSHILHNGVLHDVHGNCAPIQIPTDDDDTVNYVIPVNPEKEFNQSSLLELLCPSK